jgi:signal transduction histidine kinase
MVPSFAAADIHMLIWLPAALPANLAGGPIGLLVYFSLIIFLFVWAVRRTIRWFAIPFHNTVTKGVLASAMFGIYFTAYFVVLAYDPMGVLYWFRD